MLRFLALSILGVLIVFLGMAADTRFPPWLRRSAQDLLATWPRWGILVAVLWIFLFLLLAAYLKNKDPLERARKTRFAHFVGFAWIGVAVLLALPGWLNGLFDRSAPSDVLVTVEHCYRAERLRDTHALATVVRTVDGALEQLNGLVNPGCRAFPPGTVLRVRVRKGFFDRPWIEAIEPVQSQP
jgi:hypothetical protein